jgi:hypothetical protein
MANDYLSLLDRDFVNNYLNANYVSEDLKTVVNHLDNDLNLELKSFVVDLIKYIREIKKLYDAGMYTTEYINSKKDSFITELKLARDMAYSISIGFEERKINETKNRYKESAISDHEINLKLLELKQFELKLKACDIEGLKKIAADYRNKNVNLDIDKLNMLIAELRSRKEVMQADSLLKDIELDNVESPWINDQEYIKAEKEIKRLSSYIGGESILLDMGNGMQKVIPIDRLI